MASPREFVFKPFEVLDSSKHCFYLAHKHNSVFIFSKLNEDRVGIKREEKKSGSVIVYNAHYCILYCIVVLLIVLLLLYIASFHHY